uniref:NADH-ubiquinone oxidoreductase chain 2 n=1 Tax=Myrsidea sp. ADS-2020 TaxID=2794901 RepID=A0A7T1HF25_9NEOP|nr:NADH dehydrogenase subunit 2 [Myrsidea sp. ADS-2020]
MWMIMMQMFFLLLITSFIFSSDSFWSVWVGLELFSFFLMPWLIEGESKMSKVYVFFYFLMQFLASIGVLISSLTLLNKCFSIVLFSSLLMKMSCFPFHSWFVNILPYISWEKILVLTSLSKLTPLAIMNLYNPHQSWFIWTLILGLLVPLSGYNTSCLRSIVAYSSVAHSSWLVLCVCLSKAISLFYILMYLVISMPLCIFFMVEATTSMKSALAAKKEQAHLIITTLVLSGIPPFLGFVPKFLVVQSLVSSGALVEASIMGVMAILPIYFYFKTGILSMSMKAYMEFSFSNSFGVIMVTTLSASILALICLT